ncbi:MAG: hypothetical protein V1834_02265, partial [Candidatus Micrarchaeota archaeon]
ALVFIKPIDANYSRQGLVSALESNGSLYGVKLGLSAAGEAPSVLQADANTTVEGDPNAFHFNLTVRGEFGTPYSFNGFLDKTKTSLWVFNQSTNFVGVAFAPPGNVGFFSFLAVNSSLSVLANETLWIQSADGVVETSSENAIKRSAVRLNRD